MKVYSMPTEVPAPVVDYRNFDRDKAQADEVAHMAKLKAWLISKGYTGKNTGKEYSTHIADGYARYMFADGGSKCALIHLDYGDGYHDPDVSFIPKTEILRRIKGSEKMAQMFEEARKKKA